ncbi:MAG: GntR family transcriptional regulator [Thermoplasmata archaeon]
MFIKIELNSERPIYVQIYDQIVGAIASGELKEGTIIPSARKLSKDLGVNFHTVNKAYDILREKGFLFMNRKKEYIIQKSIDLKYIENWKELEKKMVNEAIAKGMTEKDIISVLKDILKKTKEGENL